jgi:hypothetical protein
MQQTNKHIMAIILAAALALSLSLTACGKGGDTPAENNTILPVTPDTTTLDNTITADVSTEPGEAPDTSIPHGISPTPEETPGENNTPDTSTPTGTLSESNTPDTSTLPQTPKYTMPPYDETKKAELNEYIVEFSKIAGVDIENAINEIYEKYSSFINVNISKDAIRVGTITGTGSSYYNAKGGNLTGVSPAALEKVNGFLTDNGEKPLDSSNPEQNITALWLAVSLYYDPDYVHENETYKNDPCNDIAMAFGLARANSSAGDAEHIRDEFWSVYVSLFGGPFAIKDNQ